MFSGLMSANILCQTVIHDYNGPRIIITPVELAGSCCSIINSSSDISVLSLPLLCSRVGQSFISFSNVKKLFSFFFSDRS